MENSRSEPELRYVWSQWCEKTGPPIKNTFMRYLDLANQAAERHGTVYVFAYNMDKLFKRFQLPE